MRRVLLAFFALLLLTTAGVGWYVYQRGFTKHWRNQVAEEFRRRGVEVSLRRLTLDPFRGLVARDVRVLDTRDRRRTLAVIDEVILEVNYAGLARGKTFLDALDLRDATLSLPIDPAKPKGPRIEISQLSARLFLPPQQIYLAHAEAKVFGIQVSASGRLINPQAFRPPPGTGAGFPSELAGRLVEELQGWSWAAAPPVLGVTFQGDLARPEQLLVEVTLWGERLQRQNYALQSLYLAAAYRGGICELKAGNARDGLGSLDLSGTYRPATHTAELRLRSDLDLAGLAAAFRLAPQLGEFVFYTPPALEVTATAEWGENAPAPRVTGHLALQRFAYRSVIFEGLEGDFAWAGTRWAVRDLRLAHATGVVTGDAMQTPDGFRARGTSTLHPKALQPLCTGPAFALLEQFEFATPPRLELEAHGPEISRDALTVTGTLQTGAGSYRGSAAQKLDVDFHYADRKLHLAPFQVQRAEGGGGGGLLFDFRANEVWLEKIKSSVYPTEVALWIDPKLVKDLAPYRFRARPPNLLLDGLVHTKGGKSTRLAIDLQAPGGVDYTFLNKDLRFPELSAKLLFSHDRLRLTEVAGRLFGGQVKGSADISLVRERPAHRASVQLEAVDFQSLTKLYFDYEGSQGHLSGHYDFSGRGSDARTMEGRGDLAVTDGNVFAIPFLGPFSGILESIVPGMGYNVARRAGATFSIRDGVIDTRDLVIEGRGFSMFGGGKLFYLDDRMNFDMRINAQGLPGVLLFPVSKLLEYTADEKLSKPVWRPKVVPRF